jgi:hypothetical protein
VSAKVSSGPEDRSTDPTTGADVAFFLLMFSRLFRS